MSKSLQTQHRRNLHCSHKISRNFITRQEDMNIGIPLWARATVALYLIILQVDNPYLRYSVAGVKGKLDVPVFFEACIGYFNQYQDIIGNRMGISIEIGSIL